MSEKRKPISLLKYFLTFCFTVIIFSLGFFISDYLNDKRFLEIDRIRRDFEMQILGMEAQLTHFEKILCPDIGDDILTHELHLMGERIEFMANNLGHNHPDVLHEKKAYSLLQINHYHLSREFCERCDFGLIHILYFFADKNYCPDCEKQSAILTHLRREYPFLRIYSFNYHLDLLALSIVKPIIPIEYLGPIEYLDQETKIPANNRENRAKQYLPIIVINGEPHFGFRTLQEMRELIKETRQKY